MSELSDRWRDADVKVVVTALNKASVPRSPFGTTSDGLLDLRGLRTQQPLFIKTLHASSVDLAEATLANVVLMDCSLDAWNFQRCSMTLRNNGSKLERCRFDGAGIAGSSSHNAAQFSSCSFRGADLTGVGLQGGRLEGCDFGESTFTSVDVSGAVLRECHFSGELKRCFLRFPVERCDFREATFIDCSFYGATFKDCQFSDQALLFPDWKQTIKDATQAAARRQLSDKGASALEKHVVAWLKMADLVSEQIIDLGSLQRDHGEAIGAELFGFFKALPSR
jgi:uncharacterized protein YjbI with pentapeptide repeats